MVLVVSWRASISQSAYAVPYVEVLSFGRALETFLSSFRWPMWSSYSAWTTPAVSLPGHVTEPLGRRSEAFGQLPRSSGGHVSTTWGVVLLERRCPGGSGLAMSAAGWRGGVWALNCDIGRPSTECEG